MDVLKYTVKIIRSSKDDWYHKFQFKNNAAKTFVVSPERVSKRFVIVEGPHQGKSIDPNDVFVDPLSFF